MTGTTHKAIGTAAGAAMVLYAVQTNNAIFALGMITAPLGAMLPDVDHPKTKQGRYRKTIMDKVIPIILGSCGLLLLITIVLGVVYKQVVPLLVQTCCYALPLSLSIIVAISPKFKQRFPFMYKHRGIMHTLVAAGALIITSYFIDVTLLKVLVLGLAVGYVSHLYSDSLTVTGCPLGFPLTLENVRFARVRTGKPSEYIAATIFCIVELALGWCAASDPTVLAVLLIPMTYGFGMGLPYKLYCIAPRKIKYFMRSILFAVLVIIVGIVLYKHKVVSYLVIGLGLGMLKKSSSK